MHTRFMRRASRQARAALLFALVTGGAPSARSSPETPRVSAVLMAGTVRDVDPNARTLDVVTSVGYAVRVVRMQVAGDCEIEVPGAAPELSSLTPGTLVRIEYVAAPLLARAPVGGIAVVIRAFTVEPWRTP